MKNLKKVLALGLALVMLLGMFTIASAAEAKDLVATDFTDWSSVSNKDAVSLMVDVKVLNGIKAEDGTYSYKPANTIDRGSWAKIVYFIMEGNSDASVYKTGENVFADVPDGYWAAGEIAYLKANGIVAGDSQGADSKFFPYSEISYVEAYKMVLTALGYDADTELLVGGEWATKTNRLAVKEGLKDGISAANTAKLTRDDAALIAYNALDCNMREAKERNLGALGIVPDGYEVLGPMGYEKFGLVKLNGVVGDTITEGEADVGSLSYAWDTADAATVTVSTTSIKMPATMAQRGQKVTVWATANEALKFEEGLAKTQSINVKAAATALAAGKSDALLDTYEGVTLADAFNSKSDDFVKEAASSVKVYVDAEAATEITNATWTEPQKKAVSGNRVELLSNADADGKIDTIRITTYTAVKVTADPKVTTDKDGNKKVTISGTGISGKAAEDVTGWENVSKGDIVLVNGAKTELILPEMVSGAVTRRNTTKATITVGGKAYARSSIAKSGETINNDFAAWTIEKDAEYDFYLDLNGDVIYAEKTADGDSTTDLAFLVETGFVAGTGDIGASSGKARAKLIFTDGSIQVVDVKSYKATADGAAVTKATELEPIFKVSTEESYILKDKTVVAVKATNSDDKWSLELLEGDEVADKNIKAEINLGDDTLSITANAKTVFVTWNQDTDKAAKVVGYKNVPQLTAATALEVTYEDQQYVFLTNEAGAVAESTKEIVYITNEKADMDADGNLVYKVVNTDGEEADLIVKDDDEGTIAAAVSDKGFYVVTSKDGDVVNGLEAAAESLENVTAMGNDVITINSTSFSYDADTVFVCIDLKLDKDDSDKTLYDTGSAFDPETVDISLTTDDPVGTWKEVKGFALTGSDTTKANEIADYVFIVRTPAPAEA